MPANFSVAFTLWTTTFTNIQNKITVDTKMQGLQKLTVASIFFDQKSILNTQFLIFNRLKF